MARKPRTARPTRPQATAAHAAASVASPLLNPIHSTLVTPASSTLTSAYASEDEVDELGNNIKIPSIRRLTLKDFTPSVPVRYLPPQPKKPFRFLDLPTEIRLRIYDHHFAAVEPVLDLDHENHRKLGKYLAIFRTCRLIAREASDHFYSTHAVRLFSIHPGSFFRTKRQLLARLKPRIRSMLTRLELRLGPGWSKPPDGWVVKPKMCLKECINVRLLTVFVQIDPANSYLSAFHRPGFYEGFSRNLLRQVLSELPSVERVEFDAYESVPKRSKMITELIEEAVSHGKAICWGPERGWTDGDDADDSGVELEMDIPPDMQALMGGEAHVPAVLVAA